MKLINPTSGIWRAFTTLLAFATLLPSTLPASPAMEKLLFVLKTKGSLTQDEYDVLVAAMRADDKATDTKIANANAAPASSGGSSGLDKRLAQTENKIENLENTILNTKGQVEELSRITDNTSPSTMSKTELDALLADKWYERLKLRGYIQTRFSSVLGEDDVPGVSVPNDAFVSDTQSIGIRRGRLVFSGDVTNHLYLYAQTDWMAGVGGVNSLQARDLYGDISLDPAREFRVRLGLSKVPYGFVNLQSSQNRIALERPDAINSGIEGERDLGAFFYWAPYEIRNRFKDLVKMGLRGSGDYGVIALGAYSGQGINNADRNGEPHYVARLTYPYEFGNGQILEMGISGYAGRFVPTVAAVGGGTPTFNPRGVIDRRVAINAILYPQPFGLEAEWTWGEGPQLSDDLRSISNQGLQGGYVQAVYRHVFPNQSELLPFVRWQYFDGARKYATNAPKDNVEEISIGFEYIPYPELELTVMYTHGTRTNTNDTAGLYREVQADYIGVQAQINF
ncbi:MAG: porin [Prosthecobacter sp.]